MGKFDGFLICSDMDGTFDCGGDTVAVNLDAIKYFTDNGGRFTFATGRMVSHLYNLKLNNVINAPACLCNGGIVYDYKTESIIYEKRVDFTMQEFLEIIKGYLTLDIEMRMIYNPSHNHSEPLNFSDVKNLSYDMLNVKPIKILCAFKTVECADEFKNFALHNKFFANTHISKSWSVGVEFNSIEATKGIGMNVIKNYLGDIHTTIGIGDYENDIPLICCADIGVAVGNAMDEAKKVADIVLKPGTEYAIKDLIEMIESKIESHN